MFAVPAENFGLSPPTSTKSLPAVLGASCPTSASSRTVDDRTLRGLQSRNHVDPAMDADGGAEGNHVLRNIPQHAMSRILSSPRLSEIRVQGFVAHTPVLRAGGCAVPPCAGHADQNTVLAARGRRALAHRLAAHESFTKDRCGFRLTAPRFLLEDWDAWTLNASLTTSSSYRKCLKRRM